MKQTPKPQQQPDHHMTDPKLPVIHGAADPSQMDQCIHAEPLAQGDLAQRDLLGRL